MFLTQSKEIIDALPTAKLAEKDAAKLLRSVEEEEEQMLDPLLGERLMRHLAVCYNSLIAQYGRIAQPAYQESDIELVDIEMPVGTFTVDEQEKTIRLLRTIQGALVYRMLANKIYSLSTSINLGGGANRASAGEYDPADDKHMQELRKEYYMNSRRMCDQILVQLERDAQLAKLTDGEGNKINASLWYDMWQESDGFYLKEDLLFPTLRSLKPYYPSCDAPTKFLNLWPTVRYCQDAYITPRVNEVDDTLMDILLDTTATLTAEQRKAQKLLRIALAYYVKAKECSRDERNEALMTADGAFGTALAYIEKMGPLPCPPPEEEGACPVHPDGECCGKNTLPSGGGMGGGSSCRGMGGGSSCGGMGGGCGCGSPFTTFSTLIPGVDRW